MDEISKEAPLSEQPAPTTPPKSPSRWPKLLVTGGVIVCLAALIGLVVFLLPTKKSPPGGVACTQEAKQCPDGSYVSRVPPNCDFTPCPTPAPDETANWKTYESPLTQRFSIKYPSDWKTETSPVIVNDLEVGHTDSITSPKKEITINFGEFGYHYWEQAAKGKTITFQEIVSEARKDALSDDPLMVEETVVIAGKTATEFTYNEKLPPPLTDEEYRFKHKIYIPQDKDKTFNISVNIDLREKEIYEPIFNQILSTFKFLPTSSTDGDQDQVDNSKSCRQDSDCVLRLCSGCANKEWAKTARPDLPCATYYGYSCECINNKCTETK